MNFILVIGFSGLEHNVCLRFPGLGHIEYCGVSIVSDFFRANLFDRVPVALILDNVSTLKQILDEERGWLETNR